MRIFWVISWQVYFALIWLLNSKCFPQSTDCWIFRKHYAKSKLHVYSDTAGLDSSMFHRYICIFVVLKELWKYLEDSLLPTRNYVIMALDWILWYRFYWKKLNLKTDCLTDLPCSIKHMHYSVSIKAQLSEEALLKCRALHLPSTAAAATGGICTSPGCSAASLSKHIGHLASHGQLGTLFHSLWPILLSCMRLCCLSCQMSCAPLCR